MEAHLKILADQSNDRRVHCSVNGTPLLIWEEIYIQIPVARLLRLARLVREGQDLKADTHLKANELEVYRTSECHFMVKIDSAGLFLCPMNYTSFVELIWEAARKLIKKGKGGNFTFLSTALEPLDYEFVKP